MREKGQKKNPVNMKNPEALCRLLDSEARVDNFQQVDTKRPFFITVHISVDYSHLNTDRQLSY